MTRFVAKQKNNNKINIDKPKNKLTNFMLPPKYTIPKAVVNAKNPE